jgi:hypothetical protein
MPLEPVTVVKAKVLEIEICDVILGYALGLVNS